MAQTTAAYRSFKGELTFLSTMHWYFGFGAAHVSDAALSHPSETRSVNRVFPVNSLQDVRLTHTPTEYAVDFRKNLAHLRVLLLLKGVASLEGYLHKYVEFWAVWKGYEGSKANKVNRVGKELIKAAQVSNLGNLLDYMEQLFGVTLPSRAKVAEAYQIRCAAGHNGGSVDAETARKVPRLASLRGSRIVLSWEELRDYLIALEATASKIEEVVPGAQRRRIEALWLIQDALDCLSAPEKKKQTAKTLRDDAVELHKLQGAPTKEQIAAKFKVPNE